MCWKWKDKWLRFLWGGERGGKVMVGVGRFRELEGVGIVRSVMILVSN